MVHHSRAPRLRVPDASGVVSFTTHSKITSAVVHACYSNLPRARLAAVRISVRGYLTGDCKHPLVPLWGQLPKDCADDLLSLCEILTASFGAKVVTCLSEQNSRCFEVNESQPSASAFSDPVRALDTYTFNPEISPLFPPSTMLSR